MDKVARFLADYVIRHDTVKEEERGIYEYGFLIALEILLCMITCFVISMIMGAFGEGILFFLVFIPLRSYAGGLHLDSYWSCYSLSCLTFAIILIGVKYCHIPQYLQLAMLFLFEAVIYMLYPVENKNRTVDRDENRQFKKKLQQVLILDGMLAIIFSVLQWNQYLQIVTMTFAMIVTTMTIGKIKNTKTSEM